MPKRKAAARAAEKWFRDRGEIEWIGGCLAAPFFLVDREEPYRPRLVIWMDAVSGMILSHELVTPECADGAVARALRAAMEQPMIGPPSRPSRIRVADATLVAELRRVLCDDTPIRVASTPEFDPFLQSLREAPPPADSEEASYLEGGRVPPSAVAELFSAAEVLYRMAPWKYADDTQVLRMDIPTLEVDGACVSILGNAGLQQGVAIFPSLAGFQAFTEVDLPSEPRSTSVDFGTESLSLCYERGADLPPEMRREVADHGWPVHNAKAYPLVAARERDGIPRPLTEQDIELATVCANQLVHFFARNRTLFQREELEAVCESYYDEEKRETRFAFPYEAPELFAAEDPAPPPSPALEPQRSRGRKVGRNEPCPCGSGKKYKKCHLLLDRVEPSARGERDAGRELEERLVGRLGAYARARFGEAWWRFETDFREREGIDQLTVPWSVYHYRIQGESVLSWFLKEHGQRLSRAERSWLAAQETAWLSVWEVSEVLSHGGGILVRDLLSHEERCLHDTESFPKVVQREALLARIVDRGTSATLSGLHPTTLPPIPAAEIVRRARGRLRRKRAVPVERLRDESLGRYLIRLWGDWADIIDPRGTEEPLRYNVEGPWDREWPDQANPHLGGLTPRSAVRTAAGRLTVDTLLKQVEFQLQNGLEGRSSVDFSVLRWELGIG